MSAFRSKMVTVHGVPRTSSVLRVVAGRRKEHALKVNTTAITAETERIMSKRITRQTYELPVSAIRNILVSERVA